MMSSDILLKTYTLMKENPKEALRTAEDGTPKEILQAVDRAIDAFVKDAPQFDDITMLCLEYNGPQDPCIPNPIKTPPERRVV